MSTKIWTIKNIKIYYAKIIANLSLDKFGAFILKMQKRDDKYDAYIAGQYYLFLIKSLLCNKFMKTFLKLLKRNKIKLHVFREFEGFINF